MTERPAWASATAAASPFGPEPTTTASRITLWRSADEVTCTGTSWSVGLAVHEILHLDVPALELAGGGVHEPVGLRAAVERLRLEEHHPDLAGLEAAALLEGGDELLVVEVAVAEVPAQRRAGHHLAVDDEVVLVPGPQARGTSVNSARPWVWQARKA